MQYQKHSLIDASFSEQPSIKLYTRKTDNKEIPNFIGELHFATYFIIFVVPFSLRDDKKFISDKEFDVFWNKFHYSQGEMKDTWEMFDFSDSVRKKLVFDIQFKKKGE